MIMMVSCTLLLASAASDTGWVHGQPRSPQERPAAACPAHTTEMAALTYSSAPPPGASMAKGSDAATAAPGLPLLVCEDLSSPNGTITFVGDVAPFPITLNKTVYANTVQNDSAYLGSFSKGRACTLHPPPLPTHNSPARPAARGDQREHGYHGQPPPRHPRQPAAQRRDHPQGGVGGDPTDPQNQRRADLDREPLVGRRRYLRD